MNITIKECRKCRSTPFVDYESKEGIFVMGCPNFACGEAVARKDFYAVLRLWNHDNDVKRKIETRHTF